jgi:hypothetical protein
VLANNIDLDTIGFIRETVSGWAADAPRQAAFEAVDSVGTSHMFINVVCEYGQRSIRELPACAADEQGLQLVMSSPG